MKFKVGDKVKVKKIKSGETYFYEGKAMSRRYQGRVGVVAHIFRDGDLGFPIAVMFPHNEMDRYREEELELDLNGLERATEKLK